ncbi:carboxypeptidase-like regulatory domain-containing protein [Candidatus Hydrogenedentota bacterium]
MDPPIAIPIRFVDMDGNPLAGISPSIHRAWPSGGWGSDLASGEDGRITFLGIQPGKKYQACGMKGGKAVGRSSLFEGAAGETVPEVTVVCNALGGIEGILVYSDGIPVAGEQIAVSAELPNGDSLETSAIATDSDGSFCILDVLPEGNYPDISTVSSHKSRT